MNITQYKQSVPFKPFPSIKTPTIEPNQVWLEKNRDAVAIVTSVNNGIEFDHISRDGVRYHSRMSAVLFSFRHQMCK